MKCISNLSINTYKMPYLLDKNSNIWTFYVLNWDTRTFYVLINGKMNIKWTFYVLNWNTRTLSVHSLKVWTLNVQDEKNVQTF
jgi:hypothetical protein